MEAPLLDNSNQTLLPGLQALDDVSVTVEARDKVGADTVAQYLSANDGQDASPVAVGIVITSDGQTPSSLGLTKEGLASAGFKGGAGEALVLPRDEGLVVAIGIGNTASAELHDLRQAGAALSRAASRSGVTALVLPADAQWGEAEAAALVEGALLSRYRFTTFKSERFGESNHQPLTSLTLVAQGLAEGSDRVAKLREGAQLGAISSRATIVARDLTEAPPAHLTPARLAKCVEELAGRYNFEASALKRKEIEELGCGGITAVNRGSKRGARLIQMRYEPAGLQEETKRLTLVGKGVTFDSGGLSLKPSEGMLDMKMDMGGAAAVIGAFTALSDLGVPLVVDAYIPATDNMISGDSYRLGEVLVARDGHTVEVKNTDAEGRLILMDALALARESNPDWIVDVATLTGAAVVALGTEMAALFSTDEALAEAIEKSATQTGEDVWELPLRMSYKKLLKSSMADMANVGSRWGGSITAAVFLSQFVGDAAWAHLDIAGPMSSEKDEGWVTAGATGFGARLLLALASNLGKETRAEA